MHSTPKMGNSLSSSPHCRNAVFMYDRSKIYRKTGKQLIQEEEEKGRMTLEHHINHYSSFTSNK